MDIEKLFPSKYVNGAGLGGREVTVTIARVVMEKMRPNPQTPEQEKPVVYFDRAQKGLVLEKRVAYQIAAALKENDTDRWIGKTVVLYPETIKVAGREYCVVRVKAPKQADSPPPQEDPEPETEPMTIEKAEHEVSTTTGELYGSIETDELVHRLNSMLQAKRPNQELRRKIKAAQVVLQARAEGRPVMVPD